MGSVEDDVALQQPWYPVALVVPQIIRAPNDTIRVSRGISLGWAGLGTFGAPVRWAFVHSGAQPQSKMTWAQSNHVGPISVLVWANKPKGNFGNSGRYETTRSVCRSRASRPYI